MAAILRPNRWRRQPSGLVTLDRGHAWGRSAEFVYVGGVDHELVSKEAANAFQNPAVDSTMWPTMSSVSMRDGSPAQAVSFESNVNLANENYLSVGVVSNAVNMAARPSTWAVHAISTMPPAGTDIGRHAFAERDMDYFGWGFGTVEAPDATRTGLGLFVSSTTEDAVTVSDAVVTMNEPYSFVATYPGSGSIWSSMQFFHNGQRRQPFSGYGFATGTIDDKLGSLFIGRTKRWADKSHHGYIFIVAGFEGEWSDGEAQAWDENPWQFLSKSSTPRYFQVAPTPVIPTTPVDGNLLSVTYGIRGTVEHPTNLNAFAVRARVENPRTGTYAVKAAVTQPSAQSYVLKGSAALSLAQSYTLAGSVDATLTTDYKVTGEVAQSSVTISYAVRSAIAQPLAQSYEITEPLAADFSFTYAIGTGEAARSLAFDYGIRGTTERGLDSTYFLKVEAVGRVGVTYDVRNAVSQSLAIDYAVRTAVASNALAQSHSVRMLATSTMNPVYGVRHIVSSDLAGSYAFVTPPEFSQAFSYSVKNAINTPLVSDAASQPILFGGEPLLFGGEPLTFSSLGISNYAVRNVVYGPLLPMGYAIRGIATERLAGFFDVRNNNGEKAQTFSFAVLTSVGETSAQSYSVRNAALGNLASFTYPIRVAVSQAITDNYRIRAALDQAATFSYNVKAQVVSEAALVSAVRTTVIGNQMAQFYAVNSVVEVASEQQFVYSVRKQVVSDPIDFSYGINGTTSSSALESNYAVKSLVVSERIFTYRLNFLSATNSLVALYRILTKEESALSSAYEMRGQVVSELNGAFYIIGSVESQLDCSYQMDNNNSSLLHNEYQVKAQATAVLNVEFAVRKPVSRKLQQIYAMKRRGRKSGREFEYLIGGDSIISIERNEDYDVPQKNKAKRKIVPASSKNYSDT